MKSRLLMILLLCAAMLFGGCREGGSDLFGGNSSGIGAEEFNIGERSDKSGLYTYGSSSSITSSFSSNRSAVSAESSESDPVIVVIQSTQPTQTSESAQSSMTKASDPSSSPPKSSSAPIVITVPEEPPKSSSASVVIVPNESVEDDTSVSLGDVSSNGNGDTPAGISDVTSEPEKSSSEEPSESQPETSVSPYKYEGNVYIAASGNGKKYHKNPKCSNMNGSVEMSVEEALEKGYTPCKKCW